MACTAIGHPGRADGEAAALLAQQRDARRPPHRGRTPSRPTAARRRCRHRHLRLEQRGVARARAAAARDGRGDVGGIEDDGGHAGGDAGVVRVADADAGKSVMRLWSGGTRASAAWFRPLRGGKAARQSLIPAHWPARNRQLSRRARDGPRRHRSPWRRRGWPGRHRAPRRWCAAPRPRGRSAAPAHPCWRRTARRPAARVVAGGAGRAAGAGQLDVLDALLAQEPLHALDGVARVLQQVADARSSSTSLGR